MKKNKILITGAAGLVGSNLCKYFLDRNYIVYGLDIKKISFKKKNFFFIKNNVKKFFNHTKLKFDFLVHTAAISKNKFSYLMPEETIGKNIINLLEILKYLKKKNKTKFIFLSTKQIELDILKYKILHPYSLSKKACEEILKYYSSTFNLDINIIRLTDIYSSSKKNNKPLFIKLIKNLKKNKLVEIYDKTHLFNLIHTDELNDLVKKILLKNTKKKFIIYKIYPKTKISLIKLVHLLKKKINSKSVVKIKQQDLKKRELFKEFSIVNTLSGKNKFFEKIEKLI